jgi:hypothetical protein
LTATGSSVQHKSNHIDSRLRVQAGLVQDRLEQFHRVSGGIVDDDLFASDTCDDVVSKMDASAPEPLDHRYKIVHFDRKSIPTAGPLLGAIGHGLTASRCGIRGAQNQTEVASRQHGERRCRMHDGLKPKVLTVKCNRGIHIIDDISHLNRSHVGLPFARAEVARLQQQIAREILFMQDVGSEAHECLS